MTGTNGNSNGGGTNGNGGAAQIGTSRVKQGLAQMLKGGVIVSSSSYACCGRPDDERLCSRCLCGGSVILCDVDIRRYAAHGYRQCGYLGRPCPLHDN